MRVSMQHIPWWAMPFKLLFGENVHVTYSPYSPFRKVHNATNVTRDEMMDCQRRHQCVTRTSRKPSVCESEPACCWQCILWVWPSGVSVGLSVKELSACVQSHVADTLIPHGGWFGDSLSLRRVVPMNACTSSCGKQPDSCRLCCFAQCSQTCWWGRNLRRLFCRGQR